MKVFLLSIDVTSTGFGGNDLQASEVDHAFWTLFAFLRDTRQIVNEKPIFVQQSSRVTVQVVCPEDTSLSLRPNQFVADAWMKLEALTGKPIEITLVGENAGEKPFQRPVKSAFYVLRWGWFSPLLDGDTEKPIPLYDIPPTSENGTSFDNIRYWLNAYERLHGLWMGSSVGEAYALAQLQDHDAELSIMGRKVCRRIEDVTGIPTYYFLMNYRDWTKADDNNRKCPMTGMDWQIPGRTASDMWAFKCEASRLVSELSHNCA